MRSTSEENLDRIEDGNLDLAEKPFASSSIFLASASTAAMDQELLILEPGIMRIEKPFA